MRNPVDPSYEVARAAAMRSFDEEDLAPPSVRVQDLRRELESVAEEHGAFPHPSLVARSEEIALELEVLGWRA